MIFLSVTDDTYRLRSEVRDRAVAERLQAAKLVAFSFDMVEKPWSEVTITLVVRLSPRVVNAARSAARLLSALRIDASDVDPLMPGRSRLRLSPGCAGYHPDPATRTPAGTAWHGL
jgi:hypothetical protein